VSNLVGVSCRFQRTRSSMRKPKAQGSNARPLQGAARVTRCAFATGILAAIVALVVILAMAPRSAAQTELAGVSGRVTDPSGAVIVDAEVEIKNVETNISTTVKTNSDGLYTIPSLHPGHYLINVRRPGFKSVTVTELTLNVQDNVVRNFALQVGSVSETVTINGNDLHINTTDATVSTVVDRKFVENVPLNGRSFQDLISMTPGVVTQSPQSPGLSLGYKGDFSVNGQRTESNNYTIDGVTGNIGAGAGTGLPTAANSGSLPASTALGTTQSLISVDALQEFRVQSSTYSAEYGRVPGGQFSFVTRSGTNDLHGTAFDYLRNDFFDANDWFNNRVGQPISPLRQNDFGGTLGGPILIPGLYNGKSKSFFFASYEGLRLTQPQAATIQYVPDTSLRQGAPVQLQPILSAFPLQNGVDYGNGLAQFVKSYSLPGTVNSTSIRLDHTFDSKLSLFFRFSDSPTSSAARTLSVLTKEAFNVQTYTVGATSQLSGRVYNEFRAGYARANSSVQGALDSFGGATPTNLAEAMGVGSSANSSLFFALAVPGTGVSQFVLRDSRSREWQWNLLDTASFAIGHHGLKVGVDYRRIVSPLQPSSPTVLAQYRGENSVLANNATVLNLHKFLNATPIFNEIGSFIQDEWRVEPHLTLAFGLRWEVQPPLSEAHSNLPYTLLGNLANPGTLALAPHGTPLWKTTWFNFAPRLGIAWIAHSEAGWETVVRAGGGAFFDTNNRVATQGFQAVGFSALANMRGAPLPVTPSQLAFPISATPPFTNDLIFAFPSHMQLPYTLEWNVSAQQAMGKSQALTLSYVGSNGRRLIRQQQYSLQALNPIFGNVIFNRTDLTSSYQALQLQFQRTMSHGIQALVSYTWSHCIDFGSSDLSLPATRGDCDFDLRHNFQAGASWDLPIVHGKRIVDALLDHWGLDARLIAKTAFPVNPSGAGFQGNDPVTGQFVNGGLDVEPGIPLYLYGTQCTAANLGVPCPGGKAINFTPGAVAGGCPDGTPSVGPFCFPPVDSNGNLLRQGNLGRNVLRGFGAWQINLAVRREFPIHERLRLQFRAEAFNILNHPNFGFVDPDITDATFGQATQMLNQSLGTVASQYQQGGPRSMQFALKLLF
jgi:hypothetical protein